MNPLPLAQTPDGKTADEAPAPPPSASTSPSEAGPAAIIPNSTATRPLQRVYPWLLFLSTAVAALFCLMYITKPVILYSSYPPSPPSLQSLPPVPLVSSNPTPAIPNPPTAGAGLLPDGDRLPGELHPPSAGASPSATVSGHAWPTSSSIPGFEETNLRIQHILTAEAPGGHRARIDLDVPVLYQSRNLRWTTGDVREARNLLARLMDYQEKSRQLRAEGGDLLDAWNRVISRAIPAPELRADSPSLPGNQEDAADSPHPADLITTKSIQIQPAEK